MEKPLQVFCCYAREDRSLLNQLKNHLKPLEHDGLIVVQTDIDVSPGEAWEQKIDQYLNTTQIILLLVSPDFISSEYCYSKEMKRAMERYERGETHVIPLILRPTLWDSTPFGKLQALPTDGKPVTSKFWHTPDEAFLDVAGGLRGVARTVRDTIKKVLTQLQTRKTALFGYETQGGSSSTLWSDPATFSPNETYRKWVETRRDFTESDIVDQTWVKVGDSGKFSTFHFLPHGQLYESPLLDATEQLPGSWKLIDGVLRTHIELYEGGKSVKYELDIFAKRNDLIHSGIESNNMETAHSYFVLLPSQQVAKRLEEALTAYNQLLQVNQACAKAYKAKGNLLRDLGRFEEAITAYNQALKLESNYVDAYLGKGRVYLDLKRYNDALNIYEQATNVAPNNTWAWHDKGQTLGYLQRAEEALEAFECAIELDPENTWAWFHKAETLTYLARQAYKKAGQPGGEPLKREYYNLMHKATGKCLDGNGSVVYMHAPNGGRFQLWKATEVAPNIIILKHFQSGKVLEATVERGAYLNEYNGSLSQQWIPEEVDDGYQKLKQAATGMVLLGDINNDVYLQPDEENLQIWIAAKIHITSFITPHNSPNIAEPLVFEQ